MPTETLNRWLGILALLLCCAIVFVWIPLDVESGIIDKVRRQVRLGDAFAPTLAALIIGLGGLLLLVQRPVRRQNRNQKNTASSAEVKPASSSISGSVAKISDESDRLLRRSDFPHLITTLLLVSLSILLMRYMGPLVLYLVDANAEYRLLRDTVPWKYIGFIVGGITMVVTLIAYTQKRLRPIQFLVAVIVVLLLILFYDLPFEDLLLPPNGDV